MPPNRPQQKVTISKATLCLKLHFDAPLSDIVLKSVVNNPWTYMMVFQIVAVCRGFCCDCLTKVGKNTLSASSTVILPLQGNFQPLEWMVFSSFILMERFVGSFPFLSLHSCYHCNLAVMVRNMYTTLLFVFCQIPDYLAMSSGACY